MSRRPAFSNHVKILGAQFFETIALMELVLTNLCQQPLAFSRNSPRFPILPRSMLAPPSKAPPKLYPTVSNPSTLNSPSHRKLVPFLPHCFSFPPNETPPKLFPTASFPFTLWILAPSHWTSPRAIPMVFFSSALLSRCTSQRSSSQANSYNSLSAHTAARSLPAKVSPSCFPRFSIHPRCMLGLNKLSQFHVHLRGMLPPSE